MGSHHLKNGKPVPTSKIKVALQAVYAANEARILRWIHRIIGIRWLHRGRKRVLRFLRFMLSFLPSSEVVSLDRALDFVDYLAVHGDLEIALGPCRCQEALHPDRTSKRKEMVILFGTEAYRSSLAGYERLTVQEARSALRRFHRDGLIPAFFACLGSERWLFAICHCEAESCVPLEVQKAVGKVYYPGPDIVAFDPEGCTGCGICIRRCHFGANTRNGKAVATGGAKGHGPPPKAPVLYDPASCYGCGVCVSTCPAGARRLVPREGYRSRYYPLEPILGHGAPP